MQETSQVSIAFPGARDLSQNDLRMRRGSLSRLPDALARLACMAVAAAVLLNMFEGAIRKWVLPGSSEVYFLKDFVVIGAVLSISLSSVKLKLIPGYQRVVKWFAIVAVVIGLCALNTNLGSLLTAVFGVKSYLLYPLLIVVVPRVLPTFGSLQRSVRIFLLLAIPVCLLGMAQFAAPADSALNRYAIGEEDIATFGEYGAVRITGTFAYISGHTAFLLVLLAVCLGAIGTDDRISWRLTALATLFLAIGNLFMTGSRAVFYIAGGLVVCSLVAFGFTRSAVSRRLRSFLLIAVVVTALVTSTEVKRAYEALLYRFESTDEEFMDRAFQHHDILLDLAAYSGPFGFGPGITQPGAFALQVALNLPPPAVTPPVVEAEYARILVEVGVIGAILWYAFRIVVIYALWQSYRYLNKTELRFWTFLVMLLHVLTLNGSVVLNHTFGLFYWLLAGVAFALPPFDSTPEGIGGSGG